MARKERREEDWIQKKWRPMMGWQYMVVCGFDFVAAPVLVGIYAAYTSTPLVQWVPLTLQGGGMYHLAMGAIIGITAFGRTKEKISNDLLPDSPLESTSNEK